MNIEQALQTYIAESRAMLEDMESILLRLESEPGDDEMIAALFRAAHTIKGSAGLFGLDAIVTFTHVVEEVLDRLREGAIGVSGDLVGTLLSCSDHIRNLIDAIEDSAGESDDGMHSEGQQLTRALQPYLGRGNPSPHGAGSTSDTAAPDTVASESAAPDAPAEDCAGTGSWAVRVRFGPDVIRSGMDPSSFIRYLATQGEITRLEASFDALPALADMDPEACYLGLDMVVDHIADKKIIDDAFEFVKDDCELSIAAIEAAAAPVEAEGAACMTGKADMSVVAAAADVEDAADAAASTAEGSAASGRNATQQGSQAASEAGRPARAKAEKPQGTAFLRVSADKLDALIDRVGELVIAGASASLLAQQQGHGPMLEAAAAINRLVEEIREGTLQLRMVEIGETFRRFHRLVRDAARELNKDIELGIHGAETELDKTVIEKIGDPLTHLVRNAIDHGIERADERVSSGKPARGVVRLNAYHDCGSIVIEVSDDGRGLCAEKLLAKAVQRGLVPAGVQLARQEILKLVFEPGFTTAENVSNLSGRGVGMDVVRRNIEALRGTVDIESEEGHGATVRIRLPLTLAIIDGFLVGVGSARYVVPQDMVLECMELSPADRAAAKDRNYIDLRGEILPYLSLRRQFRLEGNPGRRENIVVVQYGQNKAGLVVDELMGGFQTVIKPLGKMFVGVKGISGSTILGDGAVALILDVPSLVQAARELETAEFDAGMSV